MSATDVEVLVVGAGPVGLVAALGLAAQKVVVTVVEAGPPGTGSEWRGSTLHPPTLELLDTLGLAEPAMAGGIRVDRVQYRDAQLDAVASFDYALLAHDTRFPFRLQFEQYKLLRVLRQRAAAHPGVDLRFGTRLAAIESGDDQVTCLLEGEGTRQCLAPRWLVGADGSHSTVRKAMGIDFEGTSAADPSVVVATPLDLSAMVAGLASVSYWTGPRGRSSFIRTSDVWRVALTGDHELMAVAGQDPGDGSVDRRQRQAIAERLGAITGEQPWELRQYQTYRNHHRVAGTFRRGRVVLAGDAAHITSTLGGTGLNSGVHDAFELAARLGRVLRHGAGEEELDRYAAIRRRVAVEVAIPMTRQAGQAAEHRDLDARRSRLAALCRLAGDGDAARAFLRRASMIEATRLHPVSPLGAAS